MIEQNLQNSFKICVSFSTQMCLQLVQYSDESIEMEAILPSQNQISSTNHDNKQGTITSKLIALKSHQEKANETKNSKWVPGVQNL